MTNDKLDPARAFDLVLRGGQVIDPANKINQLMDVGIAARKIARVAPSIPSDEAVQSVDVTGLCVTPGILDIHTHVYPFHPTPKSYIEGLNPDAHLFLRA